MKYWHYLLFATGFLFLHSCTEDNPDPFILNDTATYKNDVAVDWVTVQRNLVKQTPGFSPPVAARAFGYAAMALYESVAPGIHGNVSYSGRINGWTGQGMPTLESGKNYNWELVANAAMAYMLRKQFAKTAHPEELVAIDSLEQIYVTKNAGTESTEAARSIAFGTAVATAVHNYSKTDNMDEAYLANFPAFTVPTGPGKWEPTGPNLTPLQPYWGSVRPFLLNNVEDAFLNNYPPVNYSEDPKSIFYLQANEVYVTGRNLTPPQELIARYWSDDPGLTATPPGHSMSIASQAIEQDNSNLAEAAEVLSKVGMAIHDAFISCWKCKFVYNLMRPVTYIKRFIDPTYTTLLSTPPFPEHTSGHSVQTAAAMRILESYYGYNNAITDNTHAQRTDFNLPPRTYNSFAAIASEAAISRLYGGIHFREAIEKGIDQGRIIGNNIAAIDLTK